MKKVVVFFAGVFVIGACSHSTPVKKVIEKEVSITQENLPDVHPNKLLTMEIGGMSCEMGCGGAIRKGLFASGGVERVKFDFEMGRDVNTAEISYDDTKVTEDEIEKIILELNNKQFNIGKTALSDYQEETSKPETKETSQVKKNVSPSKPTISSSTLNEDIFSVELPNIIDLLISTIKRN